MKATVIISTYNSPEWLQKVLWGYENQSVNNFDIIIADDGSKEETRTLIDRFKQNYPVKITHLWHEDKGYRRQEILNTAIVKAQHDYIIMTDGDCIPRKDFVQAHINLAEKNRFLSGGYCKLPIKTSKLIDKKDIESQDCFDVNWLNNIEKLNFSNTLKLGFSENRRKFLDKITPTKPSFNNCNSSAFKKDMIAINGYDERMKYGGPDREFGERLTNYGVKGKQIRHKAIVIHLDHPRGYKTPESLKRNLQIRKNVRQKAIKWTPFGIKK
ncbi:glycosyltransferase family 2 protein [Flavobacterium sp. CS20]|uniref:glycosyltransferase family 2 protein n=1 Tax=Flavobacterium sp. CS20 TaxID=2775246 RepID=UPI001B3A6CBE|nr:glycosyltransferase family 2 protein [Flavobacterium sp. CS20]QTY27464.1 glycosyltransferase family 2 protein [Flavobacterium sp. CS20]